FPWRAPPARDVAAIGMLDLRRALPGRRAASCRTVRPAPGRDREREGLREAGRRRSIRYRSPAERPGEKVKETQRRDRDARELPGQAPELVRPPEKVGRRIRGEQAIDLPVEREPSRRVGLTPRGFHRPIRARVSIE